MNEKQTKVYVGVIVVLLMFCNVVLTIFYNNTIRRADTKIDALTTELKAERERTALCIGTIRDCNDSVGRIAEGIGEDSDSLGAIIEQLKIIREEVMYMENCINGFYNNDFDNFNYSNSKIEGIK